MRPIFLICLALVQVIYIQGQNSLKGTVKDKLNRKGIPGAIIYIADLKSGVSADENGAYQITNLPKGTFLVVCQAVGFNTSSKRMSISGETILDFEIEESAVEMQEVIVTGSSQSTELKENPLSMAIINQSALFENASTNLIDNISKTPGINNISTGTGISKPVIRGLGYNRIVTLNNSIRQEGQQWGDEHGIEIDEFSVDRVEIIKGPGSLMYGSDAIGGVVNFLAPYPLPSGQIKGGVLANYQTNNKMQAYSLYNSGNLNSLSWLLRGSVKQSGNYKNAYDSYVYNSGFQEYDANGYIGLNKSWGFTQLGFSSFNQTIAMPEGERDSLGRFLKIDKINDTLTEEKTVDENYLKGYHYDIPKQMLSHNRITSTTHLYLNRSAIILNLGYQQNTRKEFGDVLKPQSGLNFTLGTFNYDLRFQFPEVKGWHFSLGANGMQQDNRNNGDEAIVPDYSLFDAGVFLFVKKNILERLSLAGGMRFDNRNISTKSLYIDTLDQITTQKSQFTSDKFIGFTNDYNAFTGSLGLAYKLSEITSLKLNAARGFRAPNISELASNGKHEGTLRYEIGDPDLKPETSLQTDLGILLNDNHVTIELSIFYNDIQNYIYTKKLESVFGGDSISGGNDPAPTFKYTQGQAYLYGGEFSIDIHPHPLDWLHFENSFSMVNAIQRSQPDSMKYLPFIPAPRYQGELRGEFSKAGKLLNTLYIAATFNYFLPQDKIYAAFNTETKTPDYGLCNLSAGTNVLNKKGNTLFTISLSANNLFDKAYQSHLSRLKYAPVNPLSGRKGIYNMGRNFSFKVSIPLTFKD